MKLDGYGSDITTSYKLDDLYSKLGTLPAKNITVLMDACFSGTQRSVKMLASARGVAIKALTGKPVGNMVVFSAAQGDETAFPYLEKGHGIFTYFLLKKLQESKGEATLSELGNYIIDNVRQESIIVKQQNSNANGNSIGKYRRQMAGNEVAIKELKPQNFFACSLSLTLQV